MRILIALDKFKGSLSAEDAAASIAPGPLLVERAGGRGGGRLQPVVR
jgi:glycerate kinase